MERKFRSRGFRILCDDVGVICREKIYYEPDSSCNQNNSQIRDMESKGLVSLFEYSMIEEQIDTYNFHVALANENYKSIYNDLPKLVVEKFNTIVSCFGECMKNYTVGYRLKGNVIEQQSYYFYPTVWKKCRYGIKGITEQQLIHNGIEAFVEKEYGTELLGYEPLKDFIYMIYKFKGISIHIAEGENGYKIYGRVCNILLKEYLVKYYNFNLDIFSQYGECVLAAIRLLDKKVQGINIYYLR